MLIFSACSPLVISPGPGGAHTPQEQWSFGSDLSRQDPKRCHEVLEFSASGTHRSFTKMCTWPRFTPKQARTPNGTLGFRKHRFFTKMCTRVTTVHFSLLNQQGPKTVKSSNSQRVWNTSMLYCSVYQSNHFSLPNQQGPKTRP